MVNLGPVIRDLRILREMSQGDLAIAAQVDRSSISLLEAGLRTPSFDMLQRIADALSVPLAYVVFASDPRCRNKSYGRLRRAFDRLLA